MLKALIPITLMFLIASTSEAVVRPIFSTDTRAVILLQGLSAGHPADPDARALYDQIAMPPKDVSGGQGKGIKTETGDFNLSCVARPGLPEDALCSFVVQRSERSRLSAREGRASIRVTGPEARSFYSLLAGSEASAPFRFANSTGEIRLESTPDVFEFAYEGR